MRRILLSVGTSHALLGIRNAVFVNAGYGVVPAKTCSVALRLIESRHIDAVIVVHSLFRDVKERITAAAKKKRLPVIVLHTHPSQEPIRLADANLCGIDGAAKIVEVVADLLDESLRGASTDCSRAPDLLNASLACSEPPRPGAAWKTVASKNPRASVHPDHRQHRS